MRTSDGVLDVVIVGGGVSGIYCGWRMLHDSPNEVRILGQKVQAPQDGKLRVELFERSERIGGRLLSVTPPGMPRTRCELGGMRYTSTQLLVRSLVENKLGLRTYPFLVSQPDNIAYLRGRHLRTSELIDSAKVPYGLDPQERGRDPGALFAYAIDQLIPGLLNAGSPARMRKILRTHPFEGKHVADLGFWNLLALGLSREAYAFALRASGYDCIGLNYNAVDTILLNFCDFGANIQYSSLIKGYEALPTTLCEQFQQAGGAVNLGHELVSFASAQLPDGTHGLRLILRDIDNNVDRNVLTRSLILAMPRRSLELLQQTGPLFDPSDPELKRQIQEMIRSVSPIPMFKMFLCYPFPWWTSLGIKKGQSVTDLPVRQCYYWAVESEQEGGDPRNHNAVMLATYDDILNVSFWEGYRHTREIHGPYKRKPNAFANRDHARRVSDAGLEKRLNKWEAHKAPKPMVKEIQRQIREMHPGPRYIPEPYDAAYVDWAEDPYGGGVNFWNIHARSWKIIPRMAHPLGDAPVYICGEAYSNGQGWVEGALETAELVLQKHFGLPRPAWLLQTGGG